MSNSIDMANDLIYRAKNLKVFEVQRDVGENGIFFDGTVPFDMRANHEHVWFTVYAVTPEDAEAQVDSWLGWRV